MNALRKDRITALVGALTGTAGALLVATIVLPSDPLGRSIGALLAASIAIGLAGLAFTRAVYPVSAFRRGPRPSAIPVERPLPPSDAFLRSLDAMVRSDAPAAPDFAPVAPLSAARVRRRREPAPCAALEA